MIFIYMVTLGIIKLEVIMSEPTTHIRIPISLKEELDGISKLEQRDRIIVVTRMLKEAIAREGKAAV